MEEKEVIEIMQDTCFGSLSYCCGLKKKCNPRDNAMSKLAMSNTEYEKLKNKFDEDIIKLRKKK